MRYYDSLRTLFFNFTGHHLRFTCRLVMTAIDAVVLQTTHSSLRLGNTFHHLAQVKALIGIIFTVTLVMILVVLPESSNKRL